MGYHPPKKNITSKIVLQHMTSKSLNPVVSEKKGRSSRAARARVLVRAHMPRVAGAGSHWLAQVGGQWPRCSENGLGSRMETDVGPRFDTSNKKPFRLPVWIEQPLYIIWGVAFNSQIVYISQQMSAVESTSGPTKRSAVDYWNPLAYKMW